jgi:hypothetical protein
LVSALKGWLDNQANDEQIMENGTLKQVMGTEAKDSFSNSEKVIKLLYLVNSKT